MTVSTGASAEARLTGRAAKALGASVVLLEFMALAEHLIGWRWTLLLPVPFVILAQLVIFRSVPPRAPTSTARPSWLTLLVPLGVGGFLVAGFGPVRWCSLVVACIGFRSLMPLGTLAARRGPPAALLALTLFGLGYFGAGELLTLLFTDAYRSSLAIAGVVLGSASAAWGVTGVAMSRIPLLGTASDSVSLLVVAPLCRRRWYDGSGRRAMDRRRRVLGDQRRRGRPLLSDRLLRRHHADRRLHRGTIGRGRHLDGILRQPDGRRHRRRALVSDSAGGSVASAFPVAYLLLAGALAVAAVAAHRATSAGVSTTIS